MISLVKAVRSEAMSVQFEICRSALVVRFPERSLWRHAQSTPRFHFH